MYLCGSFPLFDEGYKKGAHPMSVLFLHLIFYSEHFDLSVVYGTLTFGCESVTLNWK